MMEKVLAAIGGFILVMVLAFGFGLLMAYPTMWSINYLFSSTFLLAVFGVVKFTFWRAWVLMFVCSWLFKSSAHSSK